MVEITKREAEYLRKVIPGVHITRTVHHWYAEEIKSVLTQLPFPIPLRYLVLLLFHLRLLHYQKKP